MIIRLGDFNITINSGIIFPLLILIPNLVWMIMPKPESIPTSEEPVLLTIIENIGRFATLLIPLFYAVQWQKKFTIPVLAVMTILLLIYYSAWMRYFIHQREVEWLSKSLFGIPLPLAVAPSLFFILSSYLLDSWWMLAASVLFGISHVWITYLTA